MLAHGIARLDVLKQAVEAALKLPETELGDRLHYFKGIKSHLEANGFTARHSNVAFADRVDVRARQLRDQMNDILAETGAEKVHIIAHSMGGLDARHMIVDLDMADKVATLTTIGTPHLGTTLADFGIERGGKELIDALEPVIHLGGFEDLTTDACGMFNARAEAQEAANQVVYQTYASFEERKRVFLPLRPSGDFIKAREGENDGLVSVTSQRWKAELRGSGGITKRIAQFDFPVPADHLNEVGW